MEFKDIAAVSGKSGLYKVLSTSRTGVILETLDDDKKKMIAGMHQKVSILNEISIYTYNNEGSTPLINVMRVIYDEFESDPGVDNTSSSEELTAFFKHILPDYDETKVYVSDIKKVVSWYSILYKYAPQLLKPLQEPDNKEDETTTDGDR